MPHKRVEKRTLERVDNDIAQTKASIQRVKDLSAFGKDSKDKFIAWLRDLADASGERRDTILLQLGMMKVGPDVQHAVTWSAAQENAYQNVIDVLTDPKKVLKYYEDDLEALKNERTNYESYEQPR